MTTHRTWRSTSKINAHKSSISIAPCALHTVKNFNDTQQIQH
ncbi:hypothetical protein AK973_2337 [Pseudomonas brassicacearum]|nr:hypothetical protein AK973_2337 [Pseudomonas brassicacearum]